MAELKSTHRIFTSGIIEDPAAYRHPIDVFTSDSSPFETAEFMSLSEYEANETKSAERLSQSVVMPTDLDDATVRHCAQVISVNGWGAQNLALDMMYTLQMPRGLGELAPENDDAQTAVDSARKGAFARKKQLLMRMYQHRNLSTVEELLARARNNSGDIMLRTWDSPYYSILTRDQNETVRIRGLKSKPVAGVT